MDRQKFMKELSFLLQNISDNERQEALDFYENYFDEAGHENEQKVITELGDPSRIAAIIKDGLQGHFDDHIHVGNTGFSNDDYQNNYEVVQVEETKKEKTSKTMDGLKSRWAEMDSKDRMILIIIAVIACVPLSFSFFGIFGGLFGAGFGIFAVFLSIIFGFWIITFVLHVVAVVLIVMGFIQLFTIPGAGLIYIGVGFILIALGTIFGRIATWFFKDCIPSIVNAIADGLSKIFHPRGA